MAKRKSRISRIVAISMVVIALATALIQLLDSHSNSPSIISADDGSTIVSISGELSNSEINTGPTEEVRQHLVRLTEKAKDEKIQLEGLTAHADIERRLYKFSAWQRKVDALLQVWTKTTEHTVETINNIERLLTARPTTEPDKMKKTMKILRGLGNEILFEIDSMSESLTNLGVPIQDALVEAAYPQACQHFYLSVVEMPSPNQKHVLVALHALRTDIQIYLIGVTSAITTEHENRFTNIVGKGNTES